MERGPLIDIKTSDVVRCVECGAITPVDGQLDKHMRIHRNAFFEPLIFRLEAPPI